MELGFFGYYLIFMNVIGFIAYAINTWLYANTAESQIDTVLTIVALFGGSAGILLYILLFDRKAVKGNMMSRVFVACIFVIHIVLLLFFKSPKSEPTVNGIVQFFEKYIVLWIYLGIINVVTFVAFAIDKWAAVNQSSRIRIVTLLGLAFIGGSIGALLAMYIMRHKTRKDYFVVGVPLIIVMQLVVLIYLLTR